jgi:hypothetical protein
MALNNSGRKAFHSFLERTQATGKIEKFNIKGAVDLTPVQVAALTEVLSALWKRPYQCPASLDFKPSHGYSSRVIKDGFPPEEYARWMELGCSDTAVVETDGNGRPRLVAGPYGDYPFYNYKLVVPVASDAFGSVAVNDVIPAGLPPGVTKDAQK